MQALADRIEEQLGETPLAIVGDHLLQALLPLKIGVSREQWETVKRTFQNIIQRLPEEFGPRFYFDSYLLREVQESWQEGPATLPDTVMPVYRSGWQYETVQMPGTRRHDGRVHHLYLIGIKEENGQPIHTPPFLLDYSFLCHELAHNLVQKHEQPFVEQFEDALQEVLHEQALRRLPFRQQAKSQSEKRSDQIERHWSVTRSGMWAFELAIDVIALWTCGPAYLDTLTHYLRVHYDDKFQIEPSHPPAALRGEVLAQAARNLDWVDYVGDLETTVDDWMDEGPSSFNQYQTLTDERIVGACLNAAFEYCEQMELPQLTTGDLFRIQNQTEQDQELTGTDLIVGAWIVDQRRDEKAYHQWEQNIFHRYVEELRKEHSELSS